jgi:hypothetical protein
MAKAPRSRSDAATDRDRARRIRKLERRLAAARDLEQKRRAQAVKQDGDGHRKLAAKRRRQLEKAQGKSAAIEAELASLGGATPAAVPGAAPGAATAATAAVPDGPQGYCLRERRTVTIANPQPFVMRNGRTATAGTCPSCGARVVRP